MKPNARPAAVVAVLCAFACGEAVIGPAALTVADLEGSWVASIVRFANQANRRQVADVIERGGAYSIAIAASGSYDGSSTWPGEEPESFSGTLIKEGNRFLFDGVPAGSSEGDFTASITLAGAMATITTEDIRLEAGDLGFANDGAMEIPTFLIIVLDKQ